MRTSAARVRAGRIRVPRINIAVDRTRSMVATDFFGSIGASLATVKRLGQNASLRVGTGTARYAAYSTSVIVFNIPVSNNTVHCTVESVALLGAGTAGTCGTTELSSNKSTMTSLGTNTTSVRAGHPVIPCRNFAIDRTTESVAIFHFLSVAADLAAELGLG